MRNTNDRRKSTRLGFEILEDRTVPTTFGANKGESLAVGDVIPGGTDYEYVTGTAPGQPGEVNVYDSNGLLKQRLVPFANYSGGVYVAVGEVTGNLTSPTRVLDFGGMSIDAVGFVTVGTYFPHGYTVGQTVHVAGYGPEFDGDFTITRIISPTSFEYFNVTPAAATTTGGGSVSVYQKDIIVSTGAGSTGRVRVYEYIGNTIRSKALFEPFGPNYVGGIQLTTGDVTGNFHKEIIVGQQTNGSVVKAFSVDPNSAGGTYFEVRKTQVFEPSYKGGVSLASANIDLTVNNSSTTYDFNYSEVIVGKAVGSSIIRILDFQKPAVVSRASYMAFDDSPNVGINLAAGNTDGIRGGEIYVSLKNSTTVKVIEGQTGVALGTFSVPYPVGYGRNLEIAVNDLGDVPGPDGNILGGPVFLVSDIFIVASDGPNRQVPIVFPGIFSSPAGLNGSRPAP